MLDRLPGATRVKLERFVALLRKWQRTHNLVSATTLDDVWGRHVADSLQLLDHVPAGFREWVDLGSGAGFPGMMVAIASKGSRQLLSPLPIPPSEREGTRSEGRALRAHSSSGVKMHSPSPW